MSIIKYLKLPFLFEPIKLQEATVALSSGYWQAHYQTLHYSGSWTAIPLRSTDGQADNIFINPGKSNSYADTIFLKQSPYFKKVLSTFQCPLLAVRLLKLNAGASIKEHRDNDLFFEKGEIRIHIPIITNAGVEFYLDSERMDLQEGSCWYMNFNLLHAIQNNGNTDRIHLVIDAQVNNWVKELFNSKTIKIRKDIQAKPEHSMAAQIQIIAQLRILNTEVSNKLADEMENKIKADEINKEY